MSDERVNLEIRATVTPSSWAFLAGDEKDGAGFDPEAVAQYMEEGFHADPTVDGASVTVVTAPVETVLFSVGTDGLGNLIAYAEGREIARQYVGGSDEDDPMPYVQLARDAFFRLNREVI